MKKKNMTPEELVQYQEHYSEEAFWDKIKLLAGKAGSKLIYHALVLYYTLMDPKTPMRYKAIIAGALGYFVLPVDLMPDFLPFAGLADDWAALIAALSYVVSAINPENKAKAKEKVETWFPFAKTDDE